jgi:hypothetical protein
MLGILLKIPYGSHIPSSQAVASSDFQTDFGSRFVEAASSMPGLRSIVYQYMPAERVVVIR